MATGWLGRRKPGERDTHAWKAFLAKTPAKQLEKHLARHHQRKR